MTTFNTGNPVGSNSPQDLFDNAENFDLAMNDPAALQWVDRLGSNRKTWTGMEGAVAELGTMMQELINQGGFMPLTKAISSDGDIDLNSADYQQTGPYAFMGSGNRINFPPGMTYGYMFAFGMGAGFCVQIASAHAIALMAWRVINNGAPAIPWQIVQSVAAS